MDFALFVEIFGTTASVIVAISLTMRNIKRLRVINAIGSSLFATYGFIIHAWPVFGLNLFIFVINIYYLIQMSNHDDAFDGFEVDPLDSDYAKLFLEFWKNDIASFNPNFDLAQISSGTRGYFVLRDMVAVSLIIYKPRGDGDFDIILDYATPNHRDTKNSRYFFDWAARQFAKGNTNSEGMVRFFTSTNVAAHADYLRRIGFTTTSAQPDGREQFVKAL